MGIVVLGAGGQSRVVCDVLAVSGRGAPQLLLDDNPSLWGTPVDDVPVRGPIADIGRLLPADIAEGFVAVGCNDDRSRLHALLKAHGLASPVLVHPAATVSRGARLSSGTIVCAGAVIGPGARVGTGVIVNTGAQVDHDCEIGDFVHLAPGSVLCGGVRVDSLALVGAGACVAPLVRIGVASVVGAGAAVVEPVADGVTVIGVPARPLRAEEAGSDHRRRPLREALRARGLRDER